MYFSLFLFSIYGTSFALKILVAVKSFLGYSATFLRKAILSAKGKATEGIKP